MKKWTRRVFVSTGVLAGGAVIFGIAIRPGNRASKVAKLIAGKDDTVMNIWLKISPDNTVTAIIPHAEMGQGVHTTLAMMLADEMDADWSKMRFQEAPGHKEYANYALIKGFIAGDTHFPEFMVGTVDGIFLLAGKKINIQITGGSASVRFTGMNAMRIAGAAAKSMLLQAAANEWKVPITELTAKNSIVTHAASHRTATYAEMAPAASKLSMPDMPKLKSREAFTLMGTSPKRFDIPAKVNGTATYGIDVKLPGMKYATIKAAPIFGAKVKSMDEAVVEKMPGVLKVVNLGDAVAVIANGYWQAKQALDKLPVQFELSGHENVQQEGIYAQFARDLDAASANGKIETDKKKGKAEKMMADASKVVTAEYRIPYLHHVTMEPMNCTAWVHDNTCELWTGSQNPLGFAHDVAELLQLEIENVHVHNQLLGGGFGRRSESDVAKQAALIAKQVNYPVKLIWSREEDMQQGYYREANISRLKAGLDKDGRPVAWMHQFLYKHHPAEAPYISYDIDNQLIQYADSKTHVRWGNWRSVDHSMHGFFIESFLDEMALAAGKDPCEYRHDLLAGSPRFQKVLETAKEKSGWGSPLPPNWGRGVAIYASFGSIVAEVAEVEVSAEGKVRVHRVVCAVDPGFAMHPDGFTAQMEGGIVYGLTAAISGEITIKNGAVAQSNFHDYPVMRMDEMPKIDTYIINSDHAPGGAGEPSTPVVAAALTNAIFNATGIRIRQLPVKHHDLKRENWKKDRIG